MDQATKQFYRLQYRWKRLPHPDSRATNDGGHSLHQIELEIAHSIHLVDPFIENVLSKKETSAYENALEVIELFTRIRFALELTEDSPTREDYRFFVAKTLELLESGAALLRPFSSGS